MTVAADLLKQKKEMSNIEWSALLITPSPTESDILSTPESKEGEETWLTSETWCKLKHLQVQMPVPYQGLKKHVRNNLVLWGTLSRNWFKTENKEGGIELPSEWVASLSLTPFQKLLLVKAIRPDLLVSGTAMFVRKTLGNKYGEAPALDLNAALKVSSNTSPLIFVLSSGK